MSNPTDLEFSRQVATAATLSDKAEDVIHFFKKPVLLTGESEVLATVNGRNCFIDSIRLLARMTEDLTVQVLGSQEFQRAVEELVHKVRLNKITVTVESELDLPNFKSILSVGTRTHPELPWTVVNSNGWAARVSSCAIPLSGDCSQDNPIAALAAACFGVTEVFKRLVGLRSERGEFQDGLCFSLYEYEVKDDPGPPLPGALKGDLLVVGAGAIGNGVARLLQSLPIEGTISIVDGQIYKEENLGTCLLIGRDDLLNPKAQTLARLLAKDSVNGFDEDVQRFMSERLGKGVAYPSVVLNGLDDIEARRHVQSIWPDLAIDGAIGAVSCEVSLHPWGPDLSCLICDFELPAESAVKKESALTGLPEERLADLLAPLTEDDVSSATLEKREWLQRRIGMQKCSVISDAEVESIAQGEHDEGFAPSVPFVACLSASMVVAELVRYLAGWGPILETGYQFDVLVGPQNGIKKAHARKSSCVCVQRKRIIETFREKRNKD
jgi:hypothetical protein